MCARLATAGVARETPADHRPPVARETRRNPLSLVILAPIRLYQRLLSPLLGPRCRYYPTCSAYAEQAIRELGPLRGSIVAGWRVLRCNPFSGGGFDELADRRLFRNRRRASHGKAAA
jgi:putative membrane protein insertion efficiency factor